MGDTPIQSTRCLSFDNRECGEELLPTAGRGLAFHPNVAGGPKPEPVAARGTRQLYMGGPSTPSGMVSRQSGRQGETLQCGSRFPGQRGVPVASGELAQEALRRLIADPLQYEDAAEGEEPCRRDGLSSPATGSSAGRP
jgi:hypothetical protein